MKLKGVMYLKKAPQGTEKNDWMEEPSRQYEKSTRCTGDGLKPEMGNITRNMPKPGTKLQENAARQKSD